MAFSCKGAIRLHILKGEVSRDDQALRLSPHRMALLVALARRRASFPRAQLIDEIWEDLAAQDEERAFNAFSVCLFYLRRILGKGVILQEGGACRLHESVWVDLWEIERIVAELRGKTCLNEEEMQALRSIRERLLAPRPSLYRDWCWLEGIEQRNREFLSEISLRLARQMLLSSRPHEALSIARSLIDLDPCDEPAREIEIRAYLALGDESSAYRTYRYYREMLARELGISPSLSFFQQSFGAMPVSR